jgi:type III pantothenate kinase
MQGLITLDFGNSHPHAGLFQKNKNEWQHIKTVPFKELNIFLSQLEMNSNNSGLVLAEVKSREEELFEYLKQGFLLTRVKDYWRGAKFAGMTVHYAQTLGEDRLIQSYYLFKKDKTPTLLIDAGTFVTLDLINDGGFQGGHILPSRANYFETFKNGEQLKDVPLNTINPGLPHKTDDAMAGSYLAFVALAKSMIKEHSIARVVVTGGNSSWWFQQLAHCGEGIIVKEEKDLIHFALHYWMTTQIEPI